MDFDISSYESAPGRRRVIVVKFWGQYKALESRVEGNHFISMVIAAAVAWARPPELRLIVDFSELEYSGGDRFLSWRAVPQHCGFSDVTSRVALVWSERNRQHIRSLIEEFEDVKIAQSCFDDFGAALRWTANPE
jgi:hypothetical protein